MTTAQGKMELLILQAKAEQVNEADFISELVNKGLSGEIIAKLQILFSQVQYIGKQIINVGKIILMKLWEFIEENPLLSITIALGFALVALLSLMVGWIPGIGPMIVGILGLIIIPRGIYIGASLDKIWIKIKNGEQLGDSFIEETLEISKKFMTLLVEIFKSVKNELVSK